MVGMDNTVKEEGTARVLAQWEEHTQWLGAMKQVEWMSQSLRQLEWLLSIVLLVVVHN